MVTLCWVLLPGPYLQCGGNQFWQREGAVLNFKEAAAESPVGRGHRTVSVGSGWSGGAAGWVRPPWHGANPEFSGTAQANSTGQGNAINACQRCPRSQQSLCPSALVPSMSSFTPNTNQDCCGSPQCTGSPGPGWSLQLSRAQSPQKLQQLRA